MFYSFCNLQQENMTESNGLTAGISFEWLLTTQTKAEMEVKGLRNRLDDLISELQGSSGERKAEGLHTSANGLKRPAASPPVGGKQVVASFHTTARMTLPTRA